MVTDKSNCVEISGYLPVLGVNVVPLATPQKLEGRRKFFLQVARGKKPGHISY